MPRVRLPDVSIGGELAEARHRAGLTVADVSGSTRIGEGLIRAIEHDEFDACGGDFYARGHIRAIASVVGADPVRLIDIYDVLHPAGQPAAPAGLPRHRTPRHDRERGHEQGRGHEQRRGHPWLAPVAYALCLTAIGFAALRLTPVTSGSPASAGVPVRVASRPAASSAGNPVTVPAGPATSGTTPAAPAATPAARRSAPAAPTGRSRTRGTTPVTAPVTEVTPTGAAAFGPGGTADGDYPQGASLALSGNAGTPWHTDWYTTAHFGNLQRGTGLLLRLHRAVTAVGVTIRLGSIPGADLQVRAGITPRHLPLEASATGAGGTLRLPLAARPRIRYLLIWFTLLPPDAAGTYQAEVSQVTVSSAG